MRKEWHWIGVIGLLLTACSTTEPTQQQQAPAAAYNGPVVEISGVEPRYEPYNPGTGQDYEVNGKTYHIIKNPQNYSETGLASWYDAESSGSSVTATGEQFDAGALTAAHPTLPIPSYVRVTNVSNGRQLVVRVNDRGPYTPGRIIDLSRAAGDRLNISNNSKVRVDFIQVAPDGTLSGPGTVGTVVAKQNYALPARPTLGTGAMGTPELQSAPAADNAPVLPVANPVQANAAADDEDAGAPAASGPSQGGGFLGAPSALPAGVIESSQSEPAVAPPVVSQPPPYSSGSAAASHTAAAVAAPVAASAGGRYVVQVGAIGDRQRAVTWQQNLSQKFGVPGKVTANGALYRVQLGPFSSRQQAAGLQQRLASEAQQQSFITTAADGQ
ncbi:endolytic peptidoglycan transglycosylase RlpA [Acerihabitans arboris]|uniref:Endolytic peptidoglycan transglycosylase RlpA n=1 Tax=Acerihabitans arboris TaxID=2691583 RepID=A0A845SHA8_9GAMM|nr:endolytic peptidoglycan transglycosylase RlpA [Acerihabitans arboris]NDL62697.1 endolytic peptidoglycan transglycosylase RlpA [Acerihabitans arboris]